ARIAALRKSEVGFVGRWAAEGCHGGRFRLGSFGLPIGRPGTSPIPLPTPPPPILPPAFLSPSPRSGHFPPSHPDLTRFPSPRPPPAPPLPPPPPRHRPAAPPPCRAHLRARRPEQRRPERPPHRGHEIDRLGRPPKIRGFGRSGAPRRHPGHGHPGAAGQLLP